MKNVIYILAIFCVSSCYSQRDLIKKNNIVYEMSDWQKDSSLVKQFIYVDSIVKNNKQSDEYYCQNSVLSILEQKTKILSTGDKTFVGTKFTFRDWIKWHKWFISIFRSKSDPNLAQVCSPAIERWVLGRQYKCGLAKPQFYNSSNTAVAISTFRLR
ncbi:MAG: hypothetical protein U0T68_01875 [Ferruginibacter sp.]